MKKIITVFVVAMVALTGFFSSGRVFAEKAFTLSPMSQKVVLVPGETYRGGVSISNPVTSTEDFDYEVSITPYYVKGGNNSKDDYGGADYESKTKMNTIVDWATIDNPTGSIAPNESVTITFTVTVPANAPAGGQYMALVVSEDASKKQSSGDMAVVEKMQMAHVVYAEVTGETRNEGTIVDNNVPSFITSNVLKTSAMVKNNGNVHAEANYTLQVWPLFSNEEICTNEEKPENSLVLPNTQKYYSQECNLPMVGIFRAKQVVKIFGEESIIEKTIIVCPLWLLFVVIFGIVLLIAWIIAKTKKRKDSGRDSVSISE